MRYVACFGDSLIQGFPFGNECSWCAVAEQNENFRLLNYGICGECCDDIYHRMTKTLLSSFVNAVIFMGGANDVLCGRKAEDSIQFVQKAAAWVREKNWKFAVVLPLVSADHTLNTGLIKLTKLLETTMTGTFFIDLQSGIGYGKDEIAAAYVDGVHPTEITYTRMGLVAKKQISKWLADMNN